MWSDREAAMRVARRIGRLLGEPIEVNAYTALDILLGGILDGAVAHEVSLSDMPLDDLFFFAPKTGDIPILEEVD